MVTPLSYIHARKSPSSVPAASHPMSCQDATPPCSLSHSSLMMPMAKVASPAIHQANTSDSAMAMSADVSA